MQTISSNEDEVRSGILFMQEQIAEYNASSVVAVALDVLSEPKPWTFEDVQAMPGMTLLIVKWALQNPNCNMYLGKSISKRDFDHFRQRLWDMAGLAKVGKQNTHAMMRSLLPVQIDFQRRSKWGFMRWPSLLAKRPSDDRSRVQFFNALRVTPEQFIDVCWILQSPLREGKLEIDPQWLAAVPGHYKDSVAHVLRAIGRDFFELRAELVNHWRPDRTSSWEMFESPFARKYPLLRGGVGEDSWRVWHPAMFERGLEEAVHLSLTPLGSAYTEVFSKVFEDYVVELASEMWSDLISESNWKARMGHQAPSVEAILPADQVNIFIEAKMSLFQDRVLVDDTEGGLSQWLERVISAVEQGWKVSRLLRQRANVFPRRAEATEEYLLIVTSRELHVGGGLALKRLVPEGLLVCPDAATEKRLPLQNVFILSIETFEHLQQVVIQKKVGLRDLLDAAKAANANAKTAAMYFDDHLKKYTTSWGEPKVINTAREAATARLKAAYEPAEGG